MREIAARGELDALVPERVWQETQRALEMPAPQRFFEVLREANALPVDLSRSCTRCSACRSPSSGTRRSTPACTR